jgi:histidinol-phosphate aminotransferase
MEKTMTATRIAGLQPYIPGEQPGKLPNGREYVKLNANENPYPPSPLVADVIRKLVAGDFYKAARYPDPDSTGLRTAIAEMLNKTGGVFANAKPLASGRSVDASMIFVGNGSDEVLSFVFYAFFDSDRSLVSLRHTYSFYPVYAGYYGIPLKQIPLKSDFTVDIDALVIAANQEDSSIILANPNAPTGIALTQSEIRAMLEQAPPGRVVVVDEAYADFGAESALPLLADFPNLVIVRTFSKSLSFAGMRLGYVVASPELIRTLTTVKNSFNHFPVDVVTQTAGVAACKDVMYYEKNARQIVHERESFSEFLTQNGWLVLPSATNFVFARHRELGGHDVYQKIKAQGILVRHFATPGIEDFVRISIGTPDEMAQLREAIAGIR